MYYPASRCASSSSSPSPSPIHPSRGSPHAPICGSHRSRGALRQCVRAWVVVALVASHWPVSRPGSGACTATRRLLIASRQSHSTSTPSPLHYPLDFYLTLPIYTLPCSTLAHPTLSPSHSTISALFSDISPPSPPSTPSPSPFPVTLPFPPLRSPLPTNDAPSSLAPLAPHSPRSPLT